MSFNAISVILLLTLFTDFLSFVRCGDIFSVIIFRIALICGWKTIPTGSQRSVGRV